MIRAISIKQTGPTPKIAKAKWNKIVRKALEETAENHHRKFMRKHFTIAGGREYGYAPRKGEGKSGREFWRSYTGKKQKQKGHSRPLVWSGTSETLARIRDVRANRKRAVLVQHARGLNRRNPNSEIRMHEEISTVSEPELRESLRVAGQVANRELQNIRESRITRII